VDILIIKESSSDRVVERCWKSVGRRKDEGGGGENSDKYEYCLCTKCLGLKIHVEKVGLCRSRSRL
jgi:hypothetical protein